MIHRHLTYPASTPVERLPSAAVVDLLERGDLAEWRPIAAAIRRRPFGSFADRVLLLLDAYPMYGTSPLWRAWIDRCRAREEFDEDPVDLAGARRRMGLTQAAVARRAGMSQSDLSKFERRDDVRLSTLRAYASALGGAVKAVFATRRGRFELLIGEARPGSTRSRREIDSNGRGGKGPASASRRHGRGG